MCAQKQNQNLEPGINFIPDNCEPCHIALLEGGIEGGEHGEVSYGRGTGRNRKGTGGGLVNVQKQKWKASSVLECTVSILQALDSIPVSSKINKLKAHQLHLLTVSPDLSLTGEV